MGRCLVPFETKKIVNFTCLFEMHDAEGLNLLNTCIVQSKLSEINKMH